MEYIISAGIVVLCLACAYFGYRIGVKNRQSYTIERTIENGNVTQITHEVEPIRKEAEPEADPAKAWQDYTSKYNGD